MADDVKFGIGAEDTGFGATLEAAKLKATEASESIKASFESINATLEKVQGAFLAFTAVLAGGGAFKEIIGSTVNATVSSVALGKQFGISTTAASQLKVALDATHVTQDQLTAGNQKITMALNKNEGAFKSLGVATRDSNGDYRNTLDIQLDVNEALMKVKAGTDRNVEGVKIYGKGWLEAQEALRLTRAAMEEASEKADALGLTVGTENVAAVGRYRDALVDSHDVMEALGKVITSALMPVLSSMGEWLGSVGPTAVGIMRVAVEAIGVVFGTVVDAASALLSGLGSVFKAIGSAVMSLFGKDSDSITAMEFFGNVLRIVEVAFIAMGVGVKLAVEGIVGVIEMLAGEIKRLASVSSAMFNALAGDGKWSDVSVAWEKGSKDIENTANKHEQNMLKIATEGNEKIQSALTDAQGQAPKVTATDDSSGARAKASAAKMAALMGELNAELAAKKAGWDAQQLAQGTFIQYSLAAEEKFWTENLSRAIAGSTQRTEIATKISKLQSAIAKAAYEDELGSLKEQESAYKNNLEAKWELALKYAALIQKAQPGSKEAHKAAADVIAIERDMEAQKLAIDLGYAKAAADLKLSEIDAAEREAQLQNQLGKTSDQKLLMQEKEFEDQRYQIKVTALQQSLKLALLDPDKNPTKVAALNAQLLALQISHDATIDKLRIKSVADSNKEYKAMFATMQSGFQSTISGYLKGTASLGASVKGMFSDVTGAVVDSLSKILAQQLINAITGNAISKSSTLAQKQDAASVAAGNAWKSAAAIPYVGWILGPIEAAAAYAGVMAFGSAEGGYDIPAGINPIMQTHAREMILPSKHADVIRGLADNGGGASGGSSFSPSINVSAMDGPSFVKWMNQNAGAVSTSLKKLNSRFMASGS
jgi:hypothetical protein